MSQKRLGRRGGNWNNTSNAGVFYLNGNNARSNSDNNIGFRSALTLNARNLLPNGQRSARKVQRDMYPCSRRHREAKE